MIYLPYTYDNRFKYNAKELEDDHNLYWYHYGARYYDPQLGRWHSVDPVDEFNSPYCYVGNKVTISVDPDGMNEMTFNESGAFTGYIEDDHGWDLVTGSIEGREKKFTFNDFDKNNDVKNTLHAQNLINEFKEAGLKLPEIFYIDMNFKSRVTSMALEGISNVIPKNPGFECAAAISAGIASLPNGSMDYAAKGELYKGKFAFFLSGDKAYNLYDAGNYVWGHSMKLLNWTLPEARAGAHIFTILKHGEYDSAGDQRAIINGYNQKP